MRAATIIVVCMLWATTAWGQNACDSTSIGRSPLAETLSFGGYPGLLYDGSNARPLTHTNAGILRAANVVPRDAAGAVDSVGGKIGVVMLGMSNATYIGLELEEWVEGPSYTIESDYVEVANIGRPGRTYEWMDVAGADYWTELGFGAGATEVFVDSLLDVSGLTREQVQVVLLHNTNSSPNLGWPGEALSVFADIVEVAQVVRTELPNTELLFVSSPTYAGYAVEPAISTYSEPYSHECQWAVKWAVQYQIDGEDSLGSVAFPDDAPWMSWGPHGGLWVNGLTPRALDGMIWECSDTADNDGMHPKLGDDNGAQKAAWEIVEFLEHDPTTQGWWLADPPAIALPEEIRVGTSGTGMALGQ